MGDTQRTLQPGMEHGGYEILGWLGAGGMGSVFRARRLADGATVAIKTLHRASPDALARLKREFRGAAQVAHPNLVALHELRGDVSPSFYAMEWVDGTSLHDLHFEAIQSRHTAALTLSTAEALTREAAPVELEAIMEPPAAPSTEGDGGNSDPTPGEPLLPIERLMAIYRQIAQGVLALHEAGTVHCDLKPANVVVEDRTGRAVVLDFGLASTRASLLLSSEGRGVAGTPAYLAPERIAGQSPEPAADWYAFGAMLFESLTGAVPFGGSPSKVLTRKPDSAPPPLPQHPAISDDLRALVAALLQRDPTSRPNGPEVLRRLGARLQVPTNPVPRVRVSTFHGRKPELLQLQAAWKTVRAGASVAVRVTGLSGMGKTALLERFLAGLTGADAPGLVLRGRCYERESVPYKAVDEAIEALVHELAIDPGPILPVLTPAEATALVRVFPAFSQVLPVPSHSVATAVSQARRREESDWDERQRAFETVRRILAARASRAPIVLWIDDIQWGDGDSAAFLGSLATPPEPLQILILLSFRREDAVTSAFLAELSRLAELRRDELRLRHVAVGALPPADVLELCRHLLPADVEEGFAQRVATESRGNPFFAIQLAAHLTRTSTFSPDAVPRLEDVVMARVHALPVAARRLLQHIAVAGQPIPQRLALASAALGDDGQRALTRLRTGHFVRTRGPRVDDAVESYHDRIRESVVGVLSPALRRDCHLALARAAELAPHVDAEFAADHFHEAGAHDKAAHYGLLAGAHAADTLAFDHAATLLERAAVHRPGDVEVLERLARALASAGRSAAAAGRFLETASLCSTAEKRDAMTRNAAEQYLLGGRIAEGLAVLRPLLEAVGLPYPSSPRRALASIVGRMLALRVRGTAFRERAVTDIPADRLERIDRCWVAARGLGSVDVMRGGYYIPRATLLALEAGEPRRVAMGLAHVGLFTVARGVASEQRRGWSYLREAEAIGVRLDDPHIVGFARINSGLAHMTLGSWLDALEDLENGASLLHSRCTGVDWELSLARSTMVSVLRALGRLDEMVVRGASWMRIMRANDDRYGTVWLNLYLSQELLASGDAEGARSHIEGTMADWSTAGFTPQHATGAFLSANCDLYLGRPDRAWDLYLRRWEAAENAHALGWEVARMLSLHTRAALGLALLADDHPDARAIQRGVQRDLKQLREPGRHYSTATADLLAAVLDARRGSRRAAARKLRRAIEGYRTCGMALQEAAARWHLGMLLGDDSEEGLEERARGLEAMYAQRIVRPDRWAAMMAPGFPHQPPKNALS